jgi:hypothetical protein
MTLTFHAHAHAQHVLLFEPPERILLLEQGWRWARMEYMLAPCDLCGRVGAVRANERERERMYVHVLYLSLSLFSFLPLSGMHIYIYIYISI